MQHSAVCIRKSYVWHKKLALFLIQRLGLLNGYILAREYGARASRSFARFTLPVIEKLMHVGESPNPRRSSTGEVHRLQKIPGPPGRWPTRCCKQCRKVAPPGTRKVSESRYECVGCTDRPAWHMNCFEAWHRD